MSRRVGGSRKAERRRVLEELEASGLSVAAFARERGLSAWTLYEWRRQAREREAEPEAEALDFVEVKLARAPLPHASLQVELQTGARVLVPRGFDEGDLRRLLGVLSSC